MARKRDRAKRPARNPGSRQPKRRLLVVCEGTVTEPSYLNGFKRSTRNTSVNVRGMGEDPKSVVTAARNLRKEAIRQAKQDCDSSPAYDEVWCVFDRDQHTTFDDALQMAKGNDLKLAVSVPCFELWLLLHFRDSPGMRERGEVQHLLGEALGSKSKTVDFADYRDLHPDAHKRARLLTEKAEDDCEPVRNPTTSVYRLTDSIARPADS